MDDMAKMTELAVFEFNKPLRTAANNELVSKVAELATKGASYADIAEQRKREQENAALITATIAELPQPRIVASQRRKNRLLGGEPSNTPGNGVEIWHTGFSAFDDMSVQLVTRYGMWLRESRAVLASTEYDEPSLFQHYLPVYFLGGNPKTKSLLVAKLGGLSYIKPENPKEYVVRHDAAKAPMLIAPEILKVSGKGVGKFAVGALERVESSPSKEVVIAIHDANYGFRSDHPTASYLKWDAVSIEPLERVSQQDMMAHRVIDHLGSMAFMGGVYDQWLNRFNEFMADVPKAEIPKLFPYLARLTELQRQKKS